MFGWVGGLFVIKISNGIIWVFSDFLLVIKGNDVMLVWDMIKVEWCLNVFLMFYCLGDLIVMKDFYIDDF